jgi:CRP-like cAMP-binding protein
MAASDTAARRELLARVPVLADLAPRELDALAQVAHTRRLAAREVLFHKGDAGSQVYVVVRGRLRIYAQSADGTDVVFGIMDPGEVCGEMALLAGGKRTATAVAIEATELLGLDRRDFLALLRSRPQLSVRLLEVLAERLRRISEFVEDTVFLDLPTRLAKKLLALANSYGKPLADGGVRIDVKLSQQELGTMVGTTRESINKQLRAWRSQGIVASEGGYVVIRRRPDLVRLAGLHAG